MWLIVALMVAGAQPASARPVEAPAQPRTEGEKAVAGVEQVPVRVYLLDQTGSRFRLVEAQLTLDARGVVHEKAPPDQTLQHSFSAPETLMPPGEHVLIATLTYQGRNRGPFRYVDNIRYQVERVYPFSLESAQKPAVVHLIARERPGLTLPPEKKLMIEAIDAPASELPPTPDVAGGSDRDRVRDVTPP